MKNVLLLLLPLFAVAAFAEMAAAAKWKRGTYNVRDTLCNIGLFAGSQVVGVGQLSLLVWLFGALYSHRLLTLEPTVPVLIALVLLEDLAFYWYHRAGHEVRMFWVAHEVHHSSTLYNLSTAARQPWTSVYFFWFFWAPLPLLGFKPEWIFLQQGLNLAYQYFLHTRFMPKLGPFEWLLNTPSHHRVHHGTETKYLDRNYGGIFIIWDRLFGTFQAEDQEPTYGVLTPVRSVNPFVVVFQPWAKMLRDAWQAERLADKLGYLLRPPGWKHDGTGKTARQMQRELQQTGAPAE
jgi:sterol desaturase/sphingolipid hydroxylase (fatty acid hydroxylase superfamily)